MNEYGVLVDTEGQNHAQDCRQDDGLAIAITPVLVAPVIAIAIPTFKPLAEVITVVVIAYVIPVITIAAIQVAVVAVVVEAPAVGTIGLPGIPAFPVAITHGLLQKIGTIAVGAVPVATIAIAVVVRCIEKRIVVIVDADIDLLCPPASPLVLLIAVLRIATLAL